MYRWLFLKTFIIHPLQIDSYVHFTQYVHNILEEYYAHSRDFMKFQRLDGGEQQQQKHHYWI